MKYELHHQSAGETAIKNRNGKPAPQGWYAVFSGYEVDDGNGGHEPLIIGPRSTEKAIIFDAKREIAERWPPIPQDQVGEMFAEIIGKLQGLEPTAIQASAINIVRNVAAANDIIIPEQ